MIKKLFTWPGNGNKKSISSIFPGPFAISKFDEKWYLIVCTEEGLFKIPLEKMENE